MKKYTYLLYISIIIILLSSILPQRYTHSWYSQYLVLLFFVYLFPVFILWKFNKFLSIFIGICLFSTFFIAKIAPRSIILLTQFEALSLISYGIIKLDKSQRKLLKNAFIIVFVFQCLWILLQYFNIDPIFNCILDETKDNTVGFMGSSGQMGILQAILTPFIMPFGIIFSILTIFLSKSFFAFAAFIISTGILIWFNYKKLFKWFLLGIISIIIIYCVKIDNFGEYDFKTRLNVWKYSIESVFKGNIKTIQKDIKCNLLFGYGFGNFLTIFPYVPQQKSFNYQNEKFTHAHNDFIEHGIFETGIIGMIGLLCLVFNFLYNFIKSKKDKELIIYFSSLTAFLICASGYFVVQIAVTGFYLAVIYGMYEGCRKELNG